jgi:hydrogenase nickel incorporation protein HypB
MFHKADLVLISKTDLLPHLPDISVERIVDSLRRVMPNPAYFAVSARTGEGIGSWVNWLHEREAQIAPAHYAEAGGRLHV